MATKEKNSQKKSSTKTTEKGIDSAEQLMAAYREYVLTEGKAPASVFAFCKSLGVKEDAFYVHFASFESLERLFWKNYFDQTLTRLESDNDYHGFSTREKILTFYFALIESLKSERSFVLHQLHHWKAPVPTPVFLKDFKLAFEDWLKRLVVEGKTSGEVATRPYLDQRYHHLFWLHFSFVLHFWKSDDSANFEKTDAAIEKSVNLAFDLIGKGVLDNAIDFGKFLYQNSKN